MFSNVFHVLPTVLHDFSLISLLNSQISLMSSACWWCSHYPPCYPPGSSLISLFSLLIPRFLPMFLRLSSLILWFPHYPPCYPYWSYVSFIMILMMIVIKSDFSIVSHCSPYWFPRFPPWSHVFFHVSHCPPMCPPCSFHFSSLISCFSCCPPCFFPWYFIVFPRFPPWSLCSPWFLYCPPIDFLLDFLCWSWWWSWLNLSDDVLPCYHLLADDVFCLFCLFDLIIVVDCWLFLS